MIRRNARKFTSRIGAGTGTRLGLARTKPWASKCIWQVKNTNYTTHYTSDLLHCSFKVFKHYNSLAGSCETTREIFCTFLSPARPTRLQGSAKAKAETRDTHYYYSYYYCYHYYCDYYFFIIIVNANCDFSAKLRGAFQTCRGFLRLHACAV